MALSMQQLTLRSLNIHATHNSVLPPKSKYLRSEERHGAQCSDTESDSETDDMNVHCGQEYVYFALGTTYHQDLYPGRATRLVVSRPKKTVRKVPRKKIQWPSATDAQGLATFYQKQLGGCAPPRESATSASAAMRGCESRPSNEAHVLSMHRPGSSAAIAAQSFCAISSPAPTARPPPHRTGAPGFMHPKTSPDLALVVLRRGRVAPLRNGNTGKATSVRGTEVRAVQEA